MCDCYEHKCQLCDATIPVHVGDYRFDRDEVEAWCHRHIPDEPGVQVWKMTTTDDFGRYEKYPKGMRFGLRLQKGKLIPDDEDVCVNLSGAELEKP